MININISLFQSLVRDIRETIQESLRHSHIEAEGRETQDRSNIKFDEKPAGDVLGREIKVFQEGVVILLNVVNSHV